MGFRSLAAALSDFVADSVIGAFLATATPPDPRWEIDNATASYPGIGGTVLEIRGYPDATSYPATLLVYKDDTTNVSGTALSSPSDSVTPPGFDNAAHLSLNQDQDTGETSAQITGDSVSLQGIGGSSLSLGNSGGWAILNGTLVLIDGNAGPTVLRGSEVRLEDNAVATGTLDVSGAVALGDTLDVVGGATLDSTLDVAGLVALAGNLNVAGTIAPGTVDFTGDSITKLRYGINTVTVPGGSAFADLAIPHGQGNAPTIAVVSAVNVSTYYANVVSLTATNVNVRAIQRDGGTGGANVQVAWLAIWA